MERHDAVIRCISPSIVKIVFEKETCAAESCLEVLACAEEGAVVDCYFDWFVLEGVVEAGWRCGLGEEENGGPGAVFAFYVVGVVGSGAGGCVEGLEG